MSTRAKLITVLSIVAVLIVATLLYFVFSNPVSDTLDWTMTAYQITADGAVENSFSMTINGSILNKNNKTYLSLNVSLPDSFRYMFDDAAPDGDPVTGITAGGDLLAASYTYDREENTPAFCNYAINAEKGYFIAWWGEDWRDCLVAATDPTTTPADIMTHFEENWKTLPSAK